MSKEEQDQGFKVTDKRLFGEDGQRRPEVAAQDEAKEKGGEKEARADRAAGDLDRQPEEIGRIDFPSYILSYYTQGLVLLGEVPNPYTQKKEEDAEAARHTIEILTLLQEKTRGNLTREEEQLLGGILYELRIKYMAKTNRIKL
jgi:hypothetical protein